MLITRISLMLLVLIAAGTACAAGEAVPDIRTTRPGTTVTVDRVLKDGKLLISVSDAANEPVLGLGTAADRHFVQFV